MPDDFDKAKDRVTALKTRRKGVDELGEFTQELITSLTAQVKLYEQAKTKSDQIGEAHEGLMSWEESLADARNRLKAAKSEIAQLRTSIRAIDRYIDGLTEVCYEKTKLDKQNKDGKVPEKTYEAQVLALERTARDLLRESAPMVGR